MSVYLNHSNLSVGHTNETVIHQLIMDRVTGHTLHDIRLGLFIGKGDGRYLGNKRPHLYLNPLHAAVI